MVIWHIQPRSEETNESSLDGVGDTLSMRLSKKQIAYAEEHGAVIVNYDNNGKPAEIEILNASKFMGELLSTIIKAKTGEKQIEITA
jgi:uncharacterized protein YuzE